MNLYSSLSEQSKQRLRRKGLLRDKGKKSKQFFRRLRDVDEDTSDNQGEHKDSKWSASHAGVAHRMVQLV